MYVIIQNLKKRWNTIWGSTNRDSISKPTLYCRGNQDCGLFEIFFERILYKKNQGVSIEAETVFLFITLKIIKMFLRNSLTDMCCFALNITYHKKWGKWLPFSPKQHRNKRTIYLNTLRAKSPTTLLCTSFNIDAGITLLTEHCELFDNCVKTFSLYLKICTNIWVRLRPTACIV